MTVPDLVDIVRFVLLLLSVPVYLWFLVTLVKYRKIFPISSSFFKLCLSLGFADLEALFGQWVLAKLAKFGVLSPSEGLAKLEVFVSMHGCTNQFLGVALLACNRCTALAYFRKHQTIWSDKFLLGVIAIQWIGPFLALCPLFAADFEYNVNNITGQVGMIEWKDVNYQQAYGAVLFIYMWTMIVTTLSLYAFTFCKVRKTFAVHPTTANGSSAQNQRTELKLTIVGLSVGVIMFVYGWILFRLVTLGLEEKRHWEYYNGAWSVINDVFSWSNPWICILMSPPVRQHMWAICKRNPNQPTANVRYVVGSDRARRQEVARV